MINVIRGLILVGLPVSGYFLGGQSIQGILIGLGLAAVIIAITIFVDQIQLDVLVFGGIGALLGVVLARLVFWFIAKSDNPTIYEFAKTYSPLINLAFALAGALVAIQKKSELDILDKNIVIKGKNNSDVKVIDTSVLIDGRIADIAETGFMTGKLLVPRFVLHEVQMVADSSDSTKRQRGRRGLDILKRLQEMDTINIKIYDKDYPHIKETDSKILALAKDIGAKVATTDFNLNKVAVLQGISVLNVNELAGALKPVVLPGDVMVVYMAKEGKERSQGVGFLDDGTMVVVDDAKKLMGKRIGVLVSSILQTSAGRMIFGRISETESSGKKNFKEPASEPQSS